MRSILRLGTALLSLTLGTTVWSSCTSTLCDGSSYVPGVGDCYPPDYDIRASPSAARTDLREGKSLDIAMGARRIDNNLTLRLRDLPGVALSQNGDVAASAMAKLDDATRNVQILRSPEQLQLGQLTAEFTLPDFPTTVRTDGKHRVFRSPLLGAAMELTGSWNPNRGAAVTGRAAVQIASPVPMPGKLLVTEMISTVTGPVSWIDMYEQKPTGTVDYAMNSGWNITQTKLQESPAALFGLVLGAVLIYDTDLAAGRKDLWMVPLQQARSTKLSVYEPLIPGDAEALAACGEERAFVMARSGDVSVFLADPASISSPVKRIGRYTVTGVSVIAARGVTGAAPKLASSAFIAASVDSGGQVTLVRLTGPEGGPPSGIETSVVTSDALQGIGAVSALALADIDSDGLQDLVMARKIDDSLVYFPQYPDGSFPTLVKLGNGRPGTVSISVGDLSGDMLPDLALATSDKRAFVYINQP